MCSNVSLYFPHSLNCFKWTPNKYEEQYLDYQDPYIFSDNDWSKFCFKGFNKFHHTKELSDITIIVDGTKFLCHKILLAAASDYFHALFTSDLTDKTSNEITIKNITSDSMKQVLQYIYTGRTPINENTVQNLLSASNLFQLESLKNGCSKFMINNLDIENCIGVYFFADTHNCNDLQYHAWDIIAENYSEIACLPEFLELSAQHLIQILVYDDLQVMEREVFESVVAWVEYLRDERLSDVSMVFSYIRFALIDEHYFYDKIKDNILFKNNSEIDKLFQEVIRYKILKNRWIESDLKLEPRLGADFCRLIIYTSINQDCNDVLELYGQRVEECTNEDKTILTKLPHDISSSKILVTGDNDLYIAGNCDDENCSSDINSTVVYKWSTDSDNESFEQVAYLSKVASKFFEFIQLDKSIFIIGGCSLKDNNVAEVMHYTEEIGDWINVRSLPKPLRCLTAKSFRGKIYVFGGESERKDKPGCPKEISRSVYCYDPIENMWSCKAEMSVGRAQASSCIIDNKIYVIGGFSSVTKKWLEFEQPENLLNTTEIYDPFTDSWTKGPSLPLPLCSLGAVKYYGTIFLIGGIDSFGNNNREIYALNSSRDAWDRVPVSMSDKTVISNYSSYSVISIKLDSH